MKIPHRAKPQFMDFTINIMSKNNLNRLRPPLIMACLIAITASLNANAQTKFDFQGHRGCRGLMPENTIPAMIEALKLGVTTLEMDIVISKDNQVVVSHDPFMNPKISFKPEGETEIEGNTKSHMLYQMTYEEIKKWDVGSGGNPLFPRQQHLKVSKPLLSEVIDTVEKYAQEHHLPLPNYNIEIKSTPRGDGIEHPESELFVKMLMDVIKNKGIEKRAVVQSFDPRPLRIMHEGFPFIRLALLVENIRGIKSNIKELGFIPAIYSPYYKLTTRRTIHLAHSKGMQIIPWTVNKQEEMVRLIKKGVDGIISDYPDYFHDEKVMTAIRAK